MWPSPAWEHQSLSCLSHLNLTGGSTVPHNRFPFAACNFSHFHLALYRCVGRSVVQWHLMVNWFTALTPLRQLKRTEYIYWLPAWLLKGPVCKKWLHESFTLSETNLVFLHACKNLRRATVCSELAAILHAFFFRVEQFRVHVSYLGRALVSSNEPHRRRRRTRFSRLVLAGRQSSLKAALH